MKHTFVAAALLAAFSGTAFSQNIAKVNGVNIPSARADQMMAEIRAQSQAQGQQVPPEAQLRTMVKDELVMREIIMQEASKGNLTRDPQIAAALEAARQNVMIRAFMQDWLKKNPIPEAEMMKEYERVKPQLPERREFLARHILVEKEDDAKAIIDKLKKGGKFEELAKESKDPGSKDKGGELGWASPDTFVPEFGQAMSKLKKGEITDVPVKTMFGFHVIRLDDLRADKPSFAELKPRIEQAMIQPHLEKMRAELKAKAKIE